MKREVKYVAFYSGSVVDEENRYSSPSTINKIDYICGALKRNGFDVQIVSPGSTSSRRGFHKAVPWAERHTCAE